MKKELTDQKIFCINVYVGNLDDKDIEPYIGQFKENFKPFTELENVMCFFVPTRIESQTVINRVY